MDEWPPEVVEVVEQARRNNQPRKHHLVPDFYLSRWAVDDVLRVHRLDEGESFVTAPKNVARETDYYRVEAPGLDPDLIPPMILETVLSKIEGQGRPAIEILSQMPDAIDPTTRFDLATFMAFQYCRGHRIRLRIAAMENELLKLRAEHEDRVSIRAALIAEGVNPTEQDISDVEEAIKALLKGDLTVAPENVSILGHMFGSSDMIAQLLFERAWVVARTNSSLVTCDEPVLPIGGPGWPRDEYSGAGSAGIVAFPLDSSHVLLALRKDLAARAGLSWAPDAVARTEL